MNENKEKFDKEDTGFVILGGESDYKRHLPWWIWASIAAVVFIVIISWQILCVYQCMCIYVCLQA